MAKPTQPTMSSYLLDAAMHRFPAYPKATYRTDSNIDVQEMLEEEYQEFLDWQKTFVPSEREEEAKPFFAKPRPKLIDQLYCLELLRSVPDMVRRTLSLAKVSFKGIEMGPPLGYLREAADSYIRGRPNAAITLSRAAVEAQFRSKAAAFLGDKAVNDLDLSALLSDRRLEPLLSGDARSRANRVRAAAIEVLHKGKMATHEDGLAAVESARAVLLELGSR